MLVQMNNSETSIITLRSKAKPNYGGINKKWAAVFLQHTSNLQLTTSFPDESRDSDSVTCRRYMFADTLTRGGEEGEEKKNTWEYLQNCRNKSLVVIFYHVHQKKHLILWLMLKQVKLYGTEFRLAVSLLHRIPFWLHVYEVHSIKAFERHKANCWSKRHWYCMGCLPFIVNHLPPPFEML